nr:hypothetical protein [Tanacetum cinerariifolium]
NGDQPLPVIAQVSLAGTAHNVPPTLKDSKFWTAEEKKTRKIDHLWDTLGRQMRGSEYGEQDRKAVILYEYETFKAIEGEQLLDTYLRYLQQNQGDVNDALGYKKKAIMITSDPLAFVAEKMKVGKRKEKVVVSSDSEGHFAKDCKKAKVKDYNYYKTKMLLAKKDSDEQVLLAEDQAWMESSSDSDQEINANMVIGIGYTPMFLIHSDEALEIEKFKRARENKIEFAYDYGNLNASYVNENIKFSDDYFQEITNPDFEKNDSPFQQTSSLKQYVPTVILEKIIIDLEDEVVSLLEKEKANLKTIESLKSKGFESSEMQFLNRKIKAKMIVKWLKKSVTKWRIQK